GLVIELALMPIVLFHFHRAGLYGALANVVAIPLVTFVSMPLIALALLLDLVGGGALAWWLAGKSLELLIDIAYLTTGKADADKLTPRLCGDTLTMFLKCSLWLDLWKGRMRWLRFGYIMHVTGLMMTSPVPDLQLSGDGRH